MLFHGNFQDAEKAPIFDILAGPVKVESAVAEMSEVRSRMSAVELGTLAGVGVLDQYRMAKAETNVRWWQDLNLSMAGFYGFLATGLPLLGFVAGMAIDVAVFGGAATDLANASFFFYFFMAGSLIFAVGLGINMPYKSYLMAFLLVACAGASLIAADNRKFREHFMGWLPTALQGTALGEAREVSRIQALIVQKNATIASNKRTVYPDRGPSLLNNGFTDDDDYANKLNAQNLVLETQLQGLAGGLAVAKQRAEQASKDNWAQYASRLFGAIYIFCWLAASQLVIAGVLASAEAILVRQRRESVLWRRKLEFVGEVESGNLVKGRSLVTAAVSDLLMRFNLILTRAANGNDERRENVEQLFEAGGVEEMARIGSELAWATIHHRSDGRNR